MMALKACRQSVIFVGMPSEPEIRRCRACNKILESWKSPYCSDSCFDTGPSQAEPASAATKEPDLVEQPASAVPLNPEPQRRPEQSVYAQQGDKSVKLCRVCEKPLDAKHRRYCSMSCWQIAKGESDPVPADTNQESLEPPNGIAAANNDPPKGEEAQPKNKGGAPPKRSEEL